MAEWLQNVRIQLASWPLSRRLLFGATALGSLAFFAWLAFGTAQGGDALLFGGLPGDEMSKVVEALEDERIAFRLDAGGSAVYVPAGEVYTARIRLAGRGLPTGGGSGFELFDKPDFGVTDFVHRVNYRRALQGELARSVAALESVQRARVQIAIPERSPFAGDADRQPSASVIIELQPGGDLDANQVRGIVHLVSASVESLSPDRVTVVDQTGRLLAPLGDSGVDPAQPAGTGQYQARLERELAHRIESILGRTVGVGRVVAHVRADLDWTQQEDTEERFDPDGQVARSEQRSNESESADEGGGAAAGGVPGAASNVPGEAGAAGAGGAGGGSGRRSTRSDETINYEISKTVRRLVAPAGTVKRLTVAVLLDGKPTEAGEFEAWDDASMAKFQELAQRAVGFDDKRGDQLSIISAPFRGFDVEEEAGGWLTPVLASLVSQGLRGVLLLAALVLFGLFVVRPLLGALTGAASEPVMARVADLEAQLAATSAAALRASALDPIGPLGPLVVGGTPAIGASGAGAAGLAAASPAAGGAAAAASTPGEGDSDAPGGPDPWARSRAEEALVAIQRWLQQG